MSESRILVTGASGFIGTRLISWLASQRRAVRATVRTALARNALRNTVSDVVLVGDIERTTNWDHALEGVDVVVHLAARAHVLRERSTDPLSDFRAVNVEGTLGLAEQAARRVRRLIFLSSIGVNGVRTTHVPFSASSPAAPTEDYAISKHEAEQALWKLSESTGLEVVVVRSPLVYGPNCPGNFLRLLRLVDSGIPLPFASIQNARSLIHVDNLVNALSACADRPLARGRTYLVDDGVAISTPDLVRTLAGLLHRKAVLLPCPVSLLRWVGRMTGQGEAIARLTDSLLIDGSAIRSELDWQPVCSMSEGLMQTARWYKTRTIQASGSSRHTE